MQQKSSPDRMSYTDWSKATSLQAFETFESDVVLPPNKDDEAHKLYDFFKKKAYKIQIPAMRDKWCCNSWNGWLITINHTFPYEICCLNPISGVQIDLPPAITFEDSPPDLDETPIEFS
ncbi:hypothetical protein CK203_070381 [Vitis vinifera]|uniref:KIB1-4 beta-propeller domain-containing protein n=1 Tax=Vitis vinifera TaxID=29760 RepID=A0A438E6T2_VITVI|nr:hypothetical protein CK203_070381 [Vitis vinifera]